MGRQQMKSRPGLFGTVYYYDENGKPVRLVINCHGAGGTVTTDDSQVEHQALTQYLVANGFAVMDVNGLPREYAEKHGIDIRNNIGSPAYNGVCGAGYLND